MWNGKCNWQKVQGLCGKLYKKGHLLKNGDKFLMLFHKCWCKLSVKFQRYGLKTEDGMITQNKNSYCLPLNLTNIPILGKSEKSYKQVHKVNMLCTCNLSGFSDLVKQIAILFLPPLLSKLPDLKNTITPRFALSQHSNKLFKI